jgi:hypothetical protein
MPNSAVHTLLLTMITLQHALHSRWMFQKLKEYLLVECLTA